MIDHFGAGREYLQALIHFCVISSFDCRGAGFKTKHIGSLFEHFPLHKMVQNNALTDEINAKILRRIIKAEFFQTIWGPLVVVTHFAKAVCWGGVIVPQLSMCF